MCVFSCLLIFIFSALPAEVNAALVVVLHGAESVGYTYICIHYTEHTQSLGIVSFCAAAGTDVRLLLPLRGEEGKLFFHHNLSL